jgi:hypothetical protein
LPGITGCKQVLTSDTYAVPTEAAVLDPETQAAQILARKSNDTAYELLKISVKDETGFHAFRNGVTTDLPSGSAREDWKTYQPKSKNQQYELDQRFNDCKLEKETKNPEEWFTELEHIKVLLKENHTVILDDDKTTYCL